MMLFPFKQINPPPIGDITVLLDVAEVMMMRPLEGETGTCITFKPSSGLTVQCVRETIDEIIRSMSGAPPRPGSLNG